MLCYTKKCNRCYAIYQLISSFDKGKIETALINMLSNALKFTPDGGSIVVSTGIEDNNYNRLITIKVKDTGIGIPAKDLPYIFDRFYQSASGVQNKIGGSGIGLSLVKEIAELHSGSVYATSSETGTEVCISLPLDTEVVYISELTQNETDETISIFPDTVTTLESSGCEEEKPVVLVVEDNTDVMIFINDVLKNNYRVEVATDGIQGITAALTLIPDIIISDVMMPGKNGFEVCEHLKKDIRTSHIPFIFLTARITQEDKIYGLEQQADEYITKPFYPRELNLKIENLLKNREVLREKFSKGMVLKPSNIVVTSMEEKFLQNVIKT